MSSVEIKNIAKQYTNSKNKLDAIGDISFSLSNGEFTAVIGPNGSGKSTLLNLLLGITKPSTRGTINISPPKSKIGFVFQNYRDSLMPWASVIDNVLLPLEEMNIPKADKIKKARIALSEVGLSDFENSHIYEISGGMAQLVVLARALIIEPDLLLLDEPFSALDYQRSIQTQELLVKVWEKRPVATFMISHDIDEALYLADKIIILSARPSRINEVIKIELPRPRTFAVRISDQFDLYRERILKIIESNEISF